MEYAETAGAFLPPVLSLPALREAVAGCRGCPLYMPAIQAVFGEGPNDAPIMLIGEQPGNEEDQQGHPFVGPAGKLLDRALADAGIVRDRVYVTNSVKHFKFEQRGKRRLHKKPTLREVAACRPWLEAEAEVLHPRVIACLGATAARSVFGPGFHLSLQRGKAFVHEWAKHAMATLHPSAILRTPGDRTRREQYLELVSDLQLARKLAE